ncbi:DUF1016 N-terminal domain-containing protein [Desulfovibrio sp. OttesenSCG-928-M14]|nr:DUF1016 N-terminal domain-containing protein [Desulfovibrio sp. OttesenSCG-928-M14]
MALIEQTRSTVVAQANYALTLLFWKIGRRVNEEALQNKRADYGKQILVTLSRQLTENTSGISRSAAFVAGYSLPNNFRMMKLCQRCLHN